MTETMIIVHVQGLLSGAVATAANEYIARQSRRTNPGGTFDKGGRWYPDTIFPCCERIRSPSRGFPYSLLTHCRSIEHIAMEYSVDPHDVRKSVRTLRKKVKP